jgi:hypothetical protein
MRRNRSIAGLGAALLVGAACASSTGDELVEPRQPIAATPAALSGAIDAIGGEPYRFSLSIETGTGPDDDDPEEVLQATGEVDGDMVRVHADLSPFVAERDIPEGLSGDDLFVETIAGPDVLYARSPLVAAAGPLPDGLPDAVVEIVDALAGDWVTVDTSALDVEPLQAACLLVGVGADPGHLLDVARAVMSVERADDDREHEIDGIPVDVLVGEVPLGDIEAVGRADGAAPAVVPPLAELTAPVEVWVDGDGVVHRVRLTRDFGEVARALVDAGEIPPAAAAGAAPVLTYTVDLSDHGDDAIDVAAPDDAEDVTGPFERLLALIDGVPTGLGSMADELAALEALYADLPDWEEQLAELPALPEMEEYPTFEEMYPEHADGPPAWEDVDPGPVEPAPMPDTGFDMDAHEREMAEIDQQLSDIEDDLADIESEYGDIEDWEPPPTIDPSYAGPGG